MAGAEADSSTENEADVEEDCWERSLDVLWRRTTTGVVLLTADGSSAYALDGVSALIWETLARPMSLATLVDLLGDRLGPDRAEREREATAHVRFLVAIGAVRQCPPS